MILSITTTMPQADNLGRLLHKHPDKMQRFSLSFGEAVVVYPESSESRCTASVSVEVPPGDGSDGTPYVSDRPYSGASYLPSAILRVFGSAVAGRCEARPELVDARIPLEICITPVACRSASTPTDLFAPLGWEVVETEILLDPAYPQWGYSHKKIHLKGEQCLMHALRHIAVLLPVLDGFRHYFVGDDQVEKLLRLGDGWLEGHPLKDVIVRRYLGHRKLVSLARDAMSEAAGEVVETAENPDGTVHVRPMGLQMARISTVVERLADAGARRVADVGCGQGDLTLELLNDKRFEGVCAVDPSPIALEQAARRLQLDRMQPERKARIQLFQGAATYPDSRLSGCDAYAMLEVIEHVDPWRLDALECAVFALAKPRIVAMTTPNKEWNATIPALADGRLRHKDHRFEWTRAEFLTWAAGISERNGYQYEWFAVGPEDAEFGPPTQGVIFRRVTA